MMVMMMLMMMMVMLMMLMVVMVITSYICNFQMMLCPLTIGPFESHN